MRTRLQLTEREVEITALAAEGLRNKEIGSYLGVSEGTVRTHLRRAYMRNGIKGRTELVAAWLRTESTSRDW
jgi:DNA-binding CsgD family transcriptional regulator